MPLLGLAYLWNEGGSSAKVSSHDEVFEHREAGQAKVTPSQAAIPTPMAPAASAAAAKGKMVSSLDFIQPGDELKTKAAKSAEPAKPAAAPADNPAPTAEESSSDQDHQAPKPKKAKKKKKAAAKPKLKPAKNFLHFKNNTTPPPVGSRIFQDLPPDAQNDPAVQKYIQQQGP